MPHVIITCVSAGLKKILQSELHHIEDRRQREAFEQLVESAPECPNGGILGLEVEQQKAGTKRRPSPYNLYIGECLRRGDKSMKQCALEWRQRRQRPPAKAGGLPSGDKSSRASGPVDNGPPSRKTV